MRLLFIILLSVIWGVSVNAQSLLFEETFENIYGSTPTWLPVDQTAPKDWLNSCHAKENNGYPEALQNVYHAGTNTGRWHLDKLEPLFQGSTYRTEVTIVKATEDTRLTGETELWYHFDVLFPTDSASSDTRKTSINQWFEDGSDELTLRTMNGRCFMELQSAAGNYCWDMFSGATTFNNTSVASFAFHPLDQWDDFTFNINHKRDGTGFIKVYRNGTLIHTFTGPTIHSIVPKWKIGIYSSQTRSSVPQKAIYFDNIRVGNKNSSLTEMMGTTPSNQPPVTNAGSDQTITLPTSSVTLTGSATDADGTITIYAWTKLSGTGGTIVSASSASTSVTGLTAGSYTYRLTATDNGGATDFDDVVITVRPVPNVPPVAAAGTDQTITLPDNDVALSGSGSTDSDGTITTYAWTKISGTGGTITTPSSVTTTVTGLTAGSYTFRLTVTDNSGASATDNVVVNVLPAPNVLPVSNAGADQSITLPTSTSTFAGSGSDADGTIITYLWAKVSGPAGGTITTPSSATSGITALQEGTYSYRLTVTDNSGATASDLMQIVVNPAVPPANIAPVAVAGSDQNIQLPTTTATLSGSGSDADGTISSYWWTKISGPSVTLTTPALASTGLTGLSEGTYVFTLTVTDNGGSTGTDNVQIIVLPVANVPPTANAGGDRTLVLPTNSIELNAVLSADTDGFVVAYLWEKISGPSGGAISSATSASTMATDMQAGTYTYRLTVTDDDGATNSTAVQVFVQNAPQQGANQTLRSRKRYEVSNMKNGVFY